MQGLQLSVTCCPLLVVCCVLSVVRCYQVRGFGPIVEIPGCSIIDSRYGAEGICSLRAKATKAIWFFHNGQLTTDGGMIRATFIPKFQQFSLKATLVEYPDFACPTQTPLPTQNRISTRPHHRFLASCAGWT